MKLKYILILFLTLFLLGCDQKENVGSFVLNDDEGSIIIEGEIGEYVILPEKMKDDYIFLGWTDGENYYLGRTLLNDGKKELTAEYEPIENLFDRVHVSLGQVTLGQYLGDNKILGIPEYWHGYPIVGIQSNVNIRDIEKLYLPVSFYGRYHVINHINLTDLVYYGDLNVKYYAQMNENQLLEYQSQCPSLDIESFDESNPQTFEDCPLYYVERNDDDAVYIPGGDVYYTYSVVYQLEDHHLNQFGLRFPESLEYVKLPYFAGYDFFGKPLGQTNIVEIGTNDQVTKTDQGFYYYENEDANPNKVLFYVDSHEDVLTIDVSKYSISLNLGVSSNVKEIKLVNNDEEKYTVIDGILYTKNVNQLNDSIENELGLIIIPPAYGDTYQMPDDLFSFVYTQNMQIKKVKINNQYNNISDIIRHFPNVEKLTVDDENDNFSLEGNILYNQDQTSIAFINQSSDNKNLIIKDSVEDIQVYIYLSSVNHYSEIETVHLGQNFSGEFNFLFGLKNLVSVSVDDNNQNYMVENGVLMSKDREKIFFFNQDATSLTIEGEDIILPSPRFFNNISEIIIGDQASIANLNVLSRFDKLENIIVDEDNPFYQFRDGVLYNKEGSSIEAIVYGREVERLEIGEGVDTINLTDLRLYPYLEEIIVSDNNPYFESANGILYNKNQTQLLLYPLARPSNHLQLPDSVIKIFHLPDVIKSIYIGKDYQFTYIEEISDGYPDIVKDIVLANFNQFDNVEISSQNNHYHIDGYIASINKDIIFQILPSTREITISSNVFKVRRDAFSNAQALETINISASLGQMPFGVFELENLHTINILGDEVIDIQSYMITPYEINQWKNFVYYFDLHSLEDIYVDDDLLEAYQNHEYWSLYSDIIKGNSQD